MSGFEIADRLKFLINARYHAAQKTAVSSDGDDSFIISIVNFELFSGNAAQETVRSRKGRTYGSLQQGRTNEAFHIQNLEHSLGRLLNKSTYCLQRI